MAIALVALAGMRAHAVTLEDVVELSQAGLGDVVLIELIKMDDITYPLDPSRLRALKGAGVSDHVLLALLRSGRSADGDLPGAARRDATRRTTRSDGCRPTTRAACESVATRFVPGRVLVPARPARRTVSPGRSSGPRTSLGFGGVRGLGFRPLPTTVTTGTATTSTATTSTATTGTATTGTATTSTVTTSTVTTGTATTSTPTRREPIYWGWGGKKRPGSWNGHSDPNR